MFALVSHNNVAPIKWTNILEGLEYTLLHYDRYLIQITFYFLPPLTTLFPELPIVILFNYSAQARVSYQHQPQHS